MKVQPEMKNAGVAGPFFISIGDAEKLETFLSVNPDIPGDSCFVDGYDFDAYKSMGLQNFGPDNPPPKDIEMKAPDLGFRGWWNYFSNVMKLSPVPADMKFGEIPEGVLRLGATFVVDEDKLIYEYRDKIPGDHPVPTEVIQATT